MTRNRMIMFAITSTIVMFLFLCTPVKSNLLESNTSSNINARITSQQEDIITHTYGGEGYECAFSVIATSDDGFALAGYTSSYGAGDLDMWLVKTDVNGQVEWDRTYGGEGFDVASSVIATSDGGFALAGYTCSYGDGTEDAWLVKTDANGQVEWDRTFGGKDDAENAFSVVATSDGGFALAGYTYSYDARKTEMWLIKTDANGQVEWNQTFGEWERPLEGWSPKLEGWRSKYGGETYDERAISVVATSDGGFALAGSVGSYSAGTEDMWLVKTNANGQVEWNQTFGGEGDEHAFSVVATSDGGFALAGSVVPYSAGTEDMCLVKTNANGQVEWNQTFGGEDDARAFSVVATSDGGFALAGYIIFDLGRSIETYNVDLSYMWLVKTDATGQVEWNQKFGREGANIAALSVVATLDGGYALVGNTGNAPESDMLFVKTILHENTHYRIQKTTSFEITIILGSILVITTYYKRKKK